VTKIDSLIDVGPVTFPAYPDADAKVAKRSYDAFLQSQAVKPYAATVKASELREYLKKHGR
jgi:phage head maturation protease